MSGQVMLFTGGMLTGKTGSFADILSVQPRYRLMGGVFGAAITGAVVYAIAQLGTAKAELAIVVTQLATAYLLAVTGWLGSAQEAFAWQKLCALLVAGSGVVWYCL